jgi:hypothetical protein
MDQPAGEPSVSGLIDNFKNKANENVNNIKMSITTKAQEHKAALAGELAGLKGQVQGANLNFARGFFSKADAAPAPAPAPALGGRGRRSRKSKRSKKNKRGSSKRSSSKKNKSKRSSSKKNKRVRFSRRIKSRRY